MKKHLALFASILGLVLGSGLASASSSPAFDDLMEPYESIRLALVGDSLEGIDEQAEALRDQAEAIASETVAEDVEPLLAKIADSAGELSGAADLIGAREAFYELSKMMVQYRAKVEGDRPLVIHCAMAKKSWLQPEGEIGNPYYGRSMPTCGEVVER